MTPTPPSIRRLTDANANRAAEGLRVLEDLARFRLNDPVLSEQAKRIRHAVRASIPAHTLAGRDTEHDAGRGIETETEASRPSVRAIAQAASKRVQEALRVLEECAKLEGRDWRAIEGARYEAYELESAVVPKLRDAATQWTLCVLVTEALCARPWRETVVAAIEGGADCVQLREKNLGDRELLDRARTLVAICTERGVDTVINDRPDIAVLAGAGGVHVGQGDIPVAEARRIVGPELSVGVSTASVERAVAGISAGADVCGLGPMFPSATKPKASLAGAAYLRDYLADERTAGTPHLAISGIDADRAGTLAALGCRGVAVSAAVCSSPNPSEAAAAIVAAMTGAGASRH